MNEGERMRNRHHTKKGPGRIGSLQHNRKERQIMHVMVIKAKRCNRHSKSYVRYIERMFKAAKNLYGKARQCLSDDDFLLSEKKYEL